MHLGHPKIAPIFIKNFMNDFRAILPKKHIISDYTKCDFGPIRRHLEEQRVIRKAITDGERQRNKDVKNASMFRYGYALVDGHLEKVGNYNSEFLFVCLLVVYDTKFCVCSMLYVVSNVSYNWYLNPRPPRRRAKLSHPSINNSGTPQCIPWPWRTSQGG